MSTVNRGKIADGLQQLANDQGVEIPPTQLGILTSHVAEIFEARMNSGAPVMLSSVSFEVGTKYRVKYRIPTVHRVPRWMLARYMGVQNNVNRQELQFSGRPEFGSTSIDAEWIEGSEVMPSTAKCYADSKIPR
jgi:hypothetical protein